MLLGKLDDALTIFNMASEFYPNNEYIIAERGLIEYNKGNYAAAEASFKKALVRNNETYTCPYEGLGLVYFKQGKFNEAKDNLEKSIDINPDIEYKKYNILAKIYIQEGRLDEARVLLEKSIENYPYDNEAQQLLDEL
jgi:tetratricopeptide (TPR) repeat protein